MRVSACMYVCVCVYVSVRERERERREIEKGYLKEGRIKATNPDQVTSNHYLVSNGIDQLRQKFFHLVLPLSLSLSSSVCVCVCVCVCAREREGECMS